MGALVEMHERLQILRNQGWEPQEYALDYEEFLRLWWALRKCSMGWEQPPMVPGPYDRMKFEGVDIICCL